MAEARAVKDIEEPEGEEEAAAPEPVRPPRRWIRIGAIAVPVVAIGIGAAAYFGSGDEESEPAAAEVKKKPVVATAKEKAPAPAPEHVIYLPIDPPFIVNIQNTAEARFLQVSMELLAYGEQAEEELNKHMPAIRNSLVMLLSGQNFDALNSTEGKEELRQKALAEVKKVLKQNHAESTVEQIYYTGFVMQ